MAGLRYPIEIDLDELAGRCGWHPCKSELLAYIRGHVDELDGDCIGLHLEECGSCYAEFSAIETGGVKEVERVPEREQWSQPFRGPYRVPMNQLRLSGAFAIAIVLLTAGLIGVFVFRPARVDSGTREEPSVALAHPSIKVQGDDPTREERDRELLAANLEMPRVIAGFDRSAVLAVRGTHASSDTFSIIGPLATIVSVNRPVFRWTPLEEVESYTVSVYDDDLQLVTKSAPLKETEWVIPIRLKREVIYTWMVVGMKGGEERLAPAAPSRAEFKIMGKRAYQKLERELALTKSHGARGVLYARSGVLDEAERELRIQVRLAPSDQRARKLLAKVRSWRRPTA